MRILHTSDWHLGKNLEGISRLEEQELFLKELINIADEKKVDMVIIAGDIYDNSNPQAKAEALFYKAVKDLSNGGKRPIIIIAGNHDNPERLAAVNPLSYERGVIVLGTPKSKVPTGKCGEFNIVSSKEGCFEIDLFGERAVIIALPYPSEKRLNEVFTESLQEKERKDSYSERVGEIFASLEEEFREDTINIAVSHIFVDGGEETDSERPIQLGGSLAVSVDNLPKKAQYIALGHLHKPQKVKGCDNAYYSGSPLQYSKSEINYSKGAFLVHVYPKEHPKVESIYFKNYKPIYVWKCNGIEEAIKSCEENSDKECFVYIEVKTDRPLLQEEIKKMKELKKDIVEILPVIDFKEEEIERVDIKDMNIEEVFKKFYKSSRNNLEPNEEVVDLFLSLLLEDDNREEEC